LALGTKNGRIFHGLGGNNANMAKQMSIKAFAAANALATFGAKNSVAELATAMVTFIKIDCHIDPCSANGY
jgi:hypothetical protein